MKKENVILSIDQYGMRLLYEGLPLCNDKHTIDDIHLVALMYKCDLPAVAWNGERSEWVSTSTIST
jgi:hypothetical protein